MIIKHVEMSNSGKENLSHLNYYLKHGRDNLLTEERVQSAFTFNCIGEEPDEVIAEMRATAKLNTRSKKEKFAHFILSLSPGEHITEENWKYCATQLMETLGLKDHQALAYIHKDTDSEHIHLVVNLIKPHTLNKNILSYEYKKIGTIAAKLEKELNITEINHAQINSEAERIAQSIETLSGETSFISYMLSFKDELLTCTSWNELHSICKLHNVKIEKTGESSKNRLLSGDAYNFYGVNNDFYNYYLVIFELNEQILFIYFLLLTIFNTINTCIYCYHFNKIKIIVIIDC